MSEKLSKPTLSNDALENWLKLANGERGEVIDAWLRDTASRIVKDVFLGDFKAREKERAGAALRSIGFRGRLDPAPELTKLVMEETPGFTNAQVAGVAPLVVDVGPYSTPKKITERVKYLKKRPTGK